MSRRFSLRLLRRAAIVAFLAAVSSVHAADNRFESLGDGLACMCSCTQLLGRCEMINCPSAPPLRKELQQQIESGKDDAGILAYFSGKYGPKILSAPPVKGWFNISAWVTPFAVLVAGAFFIVLFLKRLRPAAVALPSEPTVDTSKYESQIEEELRKLTPED